MKPDVSDNIPMTATPNPPPPLAVVGPEYCTPYNRDLTVKRDWSGNFLVLDGNGGVIMKANRRLFSVRDRHVLLNADGNPIISMQKKILSPYRKWEAFRGDSRDSKDLLFSVKKTSLFKVNTFDVFLSANTSEDCCDFKIEGNFMETSSTIYHGNSDNCILAQMEEQFTCQCRSIIQSLLLGKQTFRLTVHPNVDYAFIVALIVILTEINKAEEEQDRVIDCFCDSLIDNCFD